MFEIFVFILTFNFRPTKSHNNPYLTSQIDDIIIIIYDIRQTILSNSAKMKAVFKRPGHDLGTNFTQKSG